VGSTSIRVEPLSSSVGIPTGLHDRTDLTSLLGTNTGSIITRSPRVRRATRNENERPVLSHRL
jgi:hypothetical protein